MNLKNVLYFSSFNSIGGIETFCYEVGLKYGKDYDITVVYQSGDAGMLKRISEVARVIKMRPGDEINCDVFIFGFDYGILSRVTAKKYIQTFHADYVERHLQPCMDEKVNQRIGVSEYASARIREKYGLDIETVYNPYTVKKPRKVLRLISATRLTAEKGLGRMITFAEALDAAGIPFHWDIYTDIPRDFPNKSVAIMPCRLDVLDFIAGADYLVQLSDTEGYSYSIVEALSVGTPVIVTDLPVYKEQGIENGKNGFVLPLDMSNIPVDAICKGLKAFKYIPHESGYDNIFAKGKAQYEDDRGGLVEIRCKKHYFDVVLNADQYPGDKQTVTWDRADKLSQLGVIEVI